MNPWDICYGFRGNKEASYIIAKLYISSIEESKRHKQQMKTVQIKARTSVHRAMTMEIAQIIFILVNKLVDEVVFHFGFTELRINVRPMKENKFSSTTHLDNPLAVLKPQSYFYKPGSLPWVTAYNQGS